MFKKTGNHGLFCFCPLCRNKRKISIFEPKLLIAKSKVSLAKFLYFVVFFMPDESNYLFVILKYNQSGRWWAILALKLKYLETE